MIHLWQIRHYRNLKLVVCDYIQTGHHVGSQNGGKVSRKTKGLMSKLYRGLFVPKSYNRIWIMVPLE